MNFDGEAIASVLINLLSNAMKFSPKEKEVTVNYSGMTEMLFFRWQIKVLEFHIKDPKNFHEILSVGK